MRRRILVGSSVVRLRNLGESWAVRLRILLGSWAARLRNLAERRAVNGRCGSEFLRGKWAVRVRVLFGQVGGEVEAKVQKGAGGLESP